MRLVRCDRCSNESTGPVGWKCVMVDDIPPVGPSLITSDMMMRQGGTGVTYVKQPPTNMGELCAQCLEGLKDWLRLIPDRSAVETLTDIASRTEGKQEKRI